MRGQDNITWTGARAPGVERCRSLAWRCSTEQVDFDTERRTHAAAESTKGGGKPYLRTGMLGASLTEVRSGTALSDRPALEPYRGKTRRTEVRPVKGWCVQQETNLPGQKSGAP